MNPIEIPNLDIHFTDLCNLHCEQCTHLSNYNINKSIDIDTLIRYYESWVDKIKPLTFTISGGEPLMHPQVLEMIHITRKYWKDSYIRMFSNGLLLHRYPELPKVLECEDVNLIISNHSTKKSQRYDKEFEKIQVKLMTWITQYDISVGIDYYNQSTVWFDNKNPQMQIGGDEQSPWFAFYQGYGREMKPFNDGNPRASWENCPVYNVCFQLKDNNIYKCAPLAYLPNLNEKFGLSEEWDDYLAYVPLSSDANQEEIAEFFSRQEESYCNMCPAYEHKFIPEHDPKKIYDKDLIIKV